jgi:hypothetical protein
MLEMEKAFVGDKANDMGFQFHELEVEGYGAPMMYLVSKTHLKPEIDGQLSKPIFQSNLTFAIEIEKTPIRVVEESKLHDLISF